MLALLALVSGLLLVIPDDDEQTFSMAAGSDPTGDSVSSGLGELADGRSADSVGSTTPTSITKVAGETGVFSEADTARLALATEAALVGADQTLSSSATALSLADEIALAQQAMAALSPSATTQPPTTAAETATSSSTSAAPAAVESAAPETTVAPTTGSATENPTTATENPTTEPIEETTTTPTTAAESPASESGESSGSETTAVDTSAPETTAPATTVAETTTPETTPETTAPETTVTESTTADGWVDTGNGVLVPPVLLAIRWCESTDNYTAANPSSSARGGYQFLTGSWAAYGHKDRYGVSQAHLATPVQQDEAALITWERDGTRPWNASKSCWSKRI